ncbi:MAG: pitrilysin family protein [Candidatus Omnitrophota bacterium]
MYKISKLENDVRIATYLMPKMQTAAIGVWVYVGGRDELKEKNGISHFIEHLAFKGTNKRSMLQIKAAVEGIGGVLNAFTTEELTCYLAKVSGKHAEQTTEVLLDLVLNCQCKNKDIKKERNVIFEEIKMYSDLPQHLAFDKLLKLLWPDHALGRNLTGSFQTLNNLTRKDIIRFKGHYYRAENMLITACGCLNHVKVVKVINKFFASNPELNKNRNEGNEKFIKNIIKVKESQKKAQLQIFRKDTQQTHLCFGLRALKKNDPREYVLTLMHIILGANMSSRLFNELREKKGYAYDIGTGIKKFSDTGAFFIHAGVVNKYAERVCEIILKQLTKLKNVLVPGEELQRAKEFYFGQMLMTLEDPLERMVWQGENILKTGKAKTTREIINKAKKVSAAEIRKLAKSIFINDALNLSIVGPVKNSQSQRINELLKGFN